MYFNGKSIVSINLVEPNVKDAEAVGFKLCIRGVFDDVSKENILSLVHNHHLFAKADNGLVIYEPNIP